MKTRKNRYEWIISLLLSIMILTACSGSQHGAADEPGQTQQEAAVEPTSNAETGTSIAAEPEAGVETSTAAAAEAESAATAVTAATNPEAAAETATAEALPFEAGIAEVNKYGNIILTISPDSMVKLGYEVADIIRVKIGGQEVDMPIGTAYSNVDKGKSLCYYMYSSDGGKDYVILAINMGNMLESLNIGEIRSIEEAPGYKCIWADHFDPSAPVEISMVEKQGYALEYEQHEYASPRTNVREDYAHLSDEEYANFRAVNTTGMGLYTLYRSSSPINPYLNRNEEAGQAMEKAQIKTVLNTGDDEETMTGYADYALTYYSGCDIIPINLTIDIESEDFSRKLAEGLRFLASHEGPYLIHCLEGKDRTGFVAAILECLMGAGADEVVEDYMKTYYNFYKIEPGSENYTRIANSTVYPTLAQVFDVDAIDGEDVDLAKCAEAYLIRIGLTEDEIAAVRDKLSKDFGGM